MRITGNTLKKGSIYLTQFPFTDLGQSKIRPVVVLHHDTTFDDVIVVAISSVTSRRYTEYVILISSSDESFSKTGLKKESVILSNRIVTINKKRLFYKLGYLPQLYLDELDKKILINFKIGLTSNTNQTNTTNSTNKTNITNKTSDTNATKFIPYGRQHIDDNDIYSVIKTLRSDWLTTGPKVEEFERTVADYVGAKYAIAVSSGTAALHAAMHALEIDPGDEVIVPPITFAATANCVVFQGGTPVFTDVDPNTLLIDPIKVEAAITQKTKAIIAVDYAGQPCDYDRLHKIADKHGLALVADGCHALGAEYKGKKVGSLADMTVFSFHPVKHITTGEGGMITTDDKSLANRMRLFRNHGITRDPSRFVSPEGVGIRSALCALPSAQSWFYEMLDLGYNYRLTDIQCALGLSQLTKLPEFLQRRREIAALYDEALSDISGIEPLGLRADVLPVEQSARHMAQSEGKEGAPSDSTPCSIRHAPSDFQPNSSAMLLAPSSMLSKHAYHLYVIRLKGVDREKVFKSLRERNIGVNVHYIPVHLHPFYRERFATAPGLCPIAEKVYEHILSLPMFPGMTNEDVEKVIETVNEAIMQ
jgi:perosamine synthetase